MENNKQFGLKKKILKRKKNIYQNDNKPDPNKTYKRLSKMNKTNEVSVDIDKKKAVKSIVPNDRLQQAKILKNSVQVMK